MARSKPAGRSSNGRTPVPEGGRRISTARLESFAARRERAAKIVRDLRALHPDAHCELGHRSVLDLLVATILSAQCTDVRVNLTTPAVFARYRTAADYANARPAALEALIRPTGFYRNKTKTLIALGKALVERFGGEVPDRMEDLVTLPGVGRKTANVLLSEWWGRPGIAVDTHVIRLTGPIWRLTDETDPVKIEFALYDLIPEPDRAFFGIGTIFHGRRVCSARRPDCPRCPMTSYCPSAFTIGPAASARPAAGRPGAADRVRSRTTGSAARVSAGPAGERPRRARRGGTP